MSMSVFSRLTTLFSPSQLSALALSWSHCCLAETVEYFLSELPSGYLGSCPRRRGPPTVQMEKARQPGTTERVNVAGWTMGMCGTSWVIVRRAILERVPIEGIRQ